MTSDSTLADRLAPYVPERFAGSRFAWWGRPDDTASRRWATWSRVDQLAQITERLALLIDAGSPVGVAADRIAADGRGAVVAEFGAVVEDLADGRTLGEALRAWAQAAGCDAVGALAGAVRGAASATALSTALHAQARVLRRRAHQQRVLVFERRVRALWLAALVSAVTSVAAMLS